MGLGFLLFVVKRNGAFWWIPGDGNMGRVSDCVNDGVGGAGGLV